MWDHLNDPPGPINISGHPNVDELQERVRMLSDIALSALALKINIEHGFPPTLSALNRDLEAYRKRFGGMVSDNIKAALRPLNLEELPAEKQREIDKHLGILDWDGN